jgi:hypothetical protein
VWHYSLEITNILLSDWWYTGFPSDSWRRRKDDKILLSDWWWLKRDDRGLPSDWLWIKRDDKMTDLLWFRGAKER